MDIDVRLAGAKPGAAAPGFLGENLRIRGLTEAHAWVARVCDTLHCGDSREGSGCVLRITAPRLPCGKPNAVMGFAHAARLMAQEGICGFAWRWTRPACWPPA